MINGKKDHDFEKKILKINNDLEIYYSEYKPKNINEFMDNKLLAFAGIANPENFFMLLEKNKINIKKKLVFPDHYKFMRKDLKNIINIARENKLKIVTTEKDFFKIADFKFKEINYLKVSLELQKKEKLFSKIKSFL